MLRNWALDCVVRWVVGQARVLWDWHRCHKCIDALMALGRGVAWVGGCEVMTFIPPAMTPVPGRTYTHLRLFSVCTCMDMHGLVWTYSTHAVL